MTYAQIQQELQQSQSSTHAVSEFLSMDVTLVKQIRELEFKIGKLKFERKSTTKELKELDALKKKCRGADPAPVDTRKVVLNRSELPTLKIKPVPTLATEYGKLAVYASKFPKTNKPNVILTGDTGTGKTYAMVYLGTELIENKVFPLYTTAFGLVDRFKRFIFEREERAFADLLECEILLIDDLGTEPRIPNITDENLYNLVNERLLANRPFIISTNLTPDELIDRYGERIAGRILAKETTSVIRFVGKDMRLS